MLHATPAILTTTFVGTAVAGSAIVLLVAAFNDIAARTLPNWACLAVAAFGTALRLQDGTAPTAFAIAANRLRRHVRLLVSRLDGRWRRQGCLPPACCWRRRTRPLNLILDTTLAGGVLAAIYLVLRRIAPRPLPGPRDVGLTARIWRAECWRIARRGSLPYGCAITAGALIILFIPPS